VQKILDRAGIKYTGSGSDASRLALDKIASKKIFVKNNIPTPEYVVVEKNSFKISDLASLKMPVVVKPQFEGSSIGLSVVKDASELENAITKAFEYGPGVLVESYINGRELTVGILNDKPLPVIEIVPKKKVYDFTAKYTDPDTQYLVPAPITENEKVLAQTIGLRSHSVLGCKSFSRADIIMDGQGDMFVLEVNTIPGMTARSLLPKAALAAGVNFGELCVKLLEDAIK
jgi:D-alanine--D-alanine ligase